MRQYAERSPAIVTALAPRIGYDAATRLVRQAEDQGVPLAELIAAQDAGTSSTGHVDALLAMARPYD
jgi:fumarate hydratase class II